MMSAAHLAQIKAMVKQNLPTFEHLRDNTTSPGAMDGYDSSAERR